MTEQEPERRTVTTKVIRLKGRKVEAQKDYQKIPEAELKGFIFSLLFLKFNC